MASHIAPDELNGSVENPVGDSEALGVVREMSRTRPEKFLRLNQRLQFTAFEFRRHKTAVRAALHCFQPCAVFLAY